MRLLVAVTWREVNEFTLKNSFFIQQKKVVATILIRLLLMRVFNTYISKQF